MGMDSFHPVIRDWFRQSFGQATDIQNEAWAAIQDDQSVLLSAPTGSGKTLAAFLAAINKLLVQSLEHTLEEQVYILYVSPLRALSSDIQKNLNLPLMQIRDGLLESGLPDVNITVSLRTGDTPQAERSRMRKRPPQILVTTPESLYILLTSDSGRRMLKTVQTVIVDEIHALAGNKRGAHLALSLERLSLLTQVPPNRVGISATQKPLEEIANFLTGGRPCKIIDKGFHRNRDLGLELVASPLESIMSGEIWTEVYERLVTLIQEHATTLIFVNTRRMAERVSAALAERIGNDQVTSHHGSLSREHRQSAENSLKTGKLRAIVATASLELGIDIGDIDLVCQIGSPRSISIFLQRVGRSGHALKKTPKGRLFPLSRDDLFESIALLRAIERHDLDTIRIPRHPLDVLAQQLVAEVGNGEYGLEELYGRFIRAWPYRELSLEKFRETVRTLVMGYHTSRGRRGAYIHHDVISDTLRPRKGAKLSAVTNGGAIPDQFDYDVILQPEGCFVGTLNEDFAFESLPGDIFQLGNTSYRIHKVEKGKVYVEDARGQPPNIPFWIGEAPGRSDELSTNVSDLSEQLDRLLAESDAAARHWLETELDLPDSAITQVIEYLSTSRAALGHLPHKQRIILERFFDQNGDTHLVIHSPYGSRINRAWGLALRKRFCRKFNFELQAAADENSIVLSLGPTHSFDLDEVSRYLQEKSVREILTQALLNSPIFPTRWRWVGNISLAVLRFRAGKKLPAIFQRNDAEDLIAVVFPDQLACQENIVGDREIPAHPLVEQTLYDCLHELMDIEGLENLLRGIAGGSIQVNTCDLSQPSPLASEIINARAYSFLDDAPAEERRTLAIHMKRFMTPQEASESNVLNANAIEKVRSEAWPNPRNPDELYDALCELGYMTSIEGAQWASQWNELATQQRAVRLSLSRHDIWVAIERLPEVRLIHPQACQSVPVHPVEAQTPADADTALLEILRSRLGCLGPVALADVAHSLDITESLVNRIFVQLETEGYLFRIKPQVTTGIELWCERRLLARIHRYSLEQMRNEIEPVSIQTFSRFLLHWQGLDQPAEGEAALVRCMEQLEGCNAPAKIWEQSILPNRIRDYAPSFLNNLTANGRLVWYRPVSSTAKTQRSTAQFTRMTAVSILPRADLRYWRCAGSSQQNYTLSANAEQIITLLRKNGACFFSDITSSTGLLKAQVEEGLGELVSAGMISSDSYAGLRFISKQHGRQKRRFTHRSANIALQNDWDRAGRWWVLPAPDKDHEPDHVEHIARILLKRYGVIFRKLLDNESSLPGWRELLYVYRRMEARGEIRGGRFVQEFSGEQFALIEAIPQLRKLRKQDNTEETLCISAADPLNLTGIITPGERIPAQGNNRILYRNGIPVAALVSGTVHVLDPALAHLEWQFRTTLMRDTRVPSAQKLPTLTQASGNIH